MAKSIVIDGQLSTVLDMDETQTLILALEDLSYLHMKMQITASEDQKKLLEELRNGPSHGTTHRNT